MSHPTISSLSREQVRGVTCPACGARPYERCVGARDRPRESNHRERALYAERGR